MEVEFWGVIAGSIHEMFITFFLYVNRNGPDRN
jgi:hypothetical protein